MANQLTPPYTPPDLMDGINDDHINDGLDNFLPLGGMEGFSSPTEDSFLDQKPVIATSQSVANTDLLENQLLQALLAQQNISNPLQQLNPTQQQQNDVSLLDILQQPKRSDVNGGAIAPALNQQVNCQLSKQNVDL